ncbi:hypothetical protein [Hyphomicrobium sp. NDB2Meth4]|uniref:hypothetical protein n=1 Tax=Hyphomicrobium sp. NDB2Meth4 TaxID=1892846 RepID=UPI001114EF26|nr:hypothetical protein [Hyphomicrobium sp. NDB2Meth4]
MKQLLVVVLFAVAMLGGGELPILHAPQFAEAHAFVHQHLDAGDHKHSDVGALMDVGAAHDHSDGDRQPGSDHGCTHVHAHCCSATAIITAVASAPPYMSPAARYRELSYAIPYGQLARPPLRPPRGLA